MSQAEPALPPPPAYERVPDDVSLPEFTLRAVVAGVVFGVVFGAANAYLGLRVGLTVSTSIPIAVLTVRAVPRLLRSAAAGCILEANLSQTIGSASSSLASGTIFTIPALFLWGLAPPLWQVAMLALLGGVARHRGHGAAAPPADRAQRRRAALPGGHGLRRGAARHDRGEPAGGAGSSSASPWARPSSWPSGGVGAHRLASCAAHVPVLPKAELALEIAPALLGGGLHPRLPAVRRSWSRAA